MENLKKILNESLAKKGFLKQAKSAEICFLADKWGNGLFASISFSNGLLKVFVDSAPAASELEMKKGELFEYLDKKIPKPKVKDLRIIIK